MKHKNHNKIIMNIIDDVIKTLVFNVFLQFLAFVETVSLNYLQKYIASFTAQQL